MAASTGGRRVRGSASGRPIMVLLDLLGRRWALRILYELRDAPLSFRALRTRCEEISPSVLNARIGELRDAGLVDLEEGEGYALTHWGAELGEQLMTLDGFARRWARRRS
jgi:DNA-binding HxlR family transcriptional regulator